MIIQNSFSYRLSAEEQSLLADILRCGNYNLVYVEHTKIAAETADCRIALYKSGKCLVQGKGASDFVLFVLEPFVLRRTEFGYEDILNPEAFQPHMGVDESGKGDFFGPMVVASVYVDKSLVEAMRKMNVRDSKTISSEKKMLEIGSGLQKLLGNQYSIVKIGPQAYNRLYSQMRNVNSILAWAHARAIENLMEIVPHCPRAISDQFGSTKQVEGALMKKGRQIELIQQHRAESDPAVAAASILARTAFVQALKKMEEKYETSFPKGASAAVHEAGLKLIEKHNPTILLETAKCHFKTTDVILKKLNKDRNILGPEGQAVSKPVRQRHVKKSDVC